MQKRAALQKLLQGKEESRACFMKCSVIVIEEAVLLGKYSLMKGMGVKRIRLLSPKIKVRTSMLARF